MIAAQGDDGDDTTLRQAAPTVDGDTMSVPAHEPHEIESAPPSGSGAVDAAHVAVSALVRLGLEHLVIAPGSRSAPLVYAAAALEHSGHGGQFRVHVRHDERAAAFLALGLSKAGQFAGVVTTSGTASAHLLAAAMEAHHAHVPLLLITADRPAELRGTGANQTSIQPGMFSHFARTHDVPAPTAERASESELRVAVDTVARAFAEAQHESRAVHVNFGFRDPLTPRGECSGEREQQRATPIRVAVRERPALSSAPLTVDPRTLIVVGDASASEGQCARRIADRLDLPLIAEPSSRAREARHLVLAPADTITHLMNRERADDPRVNDTDARARDILVFGHPTLSRPVARTLLAEPHARIVYASAHVPWIDPTRRASMIIPLPDPGTTRLNGDPDPAFTRAWVDVGQRAHEAAMARLSPQARAALAVWEACAAQASPLVLGASALIRDLDTLAGPSSAPVYSNRGLAGIDGTFSTATGIALAHGTDSGARTRVLVGDVTAIHDLTSLVIGPTEEEPDLDLIIIDDNGGRIFAGLEHQAAPRTLFERFFTTPHGLDLARVCESLGIRTRRCTPESLASELSAGASQRGRMAYVVTIRSTPTGKTS